MRVIGTDPVGKQIKDGGRSVIVRGGALGDCVLTLPLAHELLKLGPVSMLTREAYFPILESLSGRLSLHALDSAGTATLFSTDPSPEWRDVFQDATIYDYMPGDDGIFHANLIRLGASKRIAIPSRPNRPPHAAIQALAEAGIPDSSDLHRISLLRHKRGKAGKAAWIHPGSGSPTKNTPVGRLREIYQQLPGTPSIVASFGEADLALIPAFKEAFEGTDFEIRQPTSIGQLLEQLSREAATFLGNDSGPGHLASALGIPTTIVFHDTDPAIWMPLGSDVQALRE